jgi:hypothetical protein
MNLMFLTDDEQKYLHHILATYRGPGDALRDAVGALMVGKVYGWRVLRVMYGGKLYAKFQRTLQLDFKEWCEPETEFAARHRGYQAALKVGDFWKLVRGDMPQPEGYSEVKKVFG